MIEVNDMPMTVNNIQLSLRDRHIRLGDRKMSLADRHIRLDDSVDVAQRHEGITDQQFAMAAGDTFVAEGQINESVGCVSEAECHARGTVRHANVAGQGEAT
jgi:hypothetical protein